MHVRRIDLSGRRARLHVCRRSAGWRHQDEADDCQLVQATCCLTSNAPALLLFACCLQGLAMLISAAARMQHHPGTAWLDAFHAYVCAQPGQLDAVFVERVRDALRLLDYHPAVQQRADSPASPGLRLTALAGKPAAAAAAGVDHPAPLLPLARPARLRLTVTPQGAIGAARPPASVRSLGGGAEGAAQGESLGSPVQAGCAPSSGSDAAGIIRMHERAARTDDDAHGEAAGGNSVPYAGAARGGRAAPPGLRLQAAEGGQALEPVAAAPQAASAPLPSDDTLAWAVHGAVVPEEQLAVLVKPSRFAP